MLDSNLIFAEGQDVVNVGDTASTKVYDAGGANGQGDAGLTGEHLWLNAVCTKAVTSAGAATVQAVLQDSADNVNFADVVAGPVVAKANAVAGATLLQVQPPPGMREYWRIAWRVGTAALTAGEFDAWVSESLQNNVARASGFAVQ